MQTATALLAQKKFQDGLVFLKINKLNEAETAFAEALALDETNPDFWLHLGIVWGKMGRAEPAEEALLAALRLAPTNPDILYNIGLALTEAGNPAKALPYFEKSCHLKPDRKLAETLGDTAYLDSNYPKAAVFYNKALELAPNDATIKAKLGQSIYLSGNAGPAIKLYASLVTDYPDNEAYASTLVDMFQRYHYPEFTPSARATLLTLLNRSDLKHRYLSAAWSILVLLDPALQALYHFALNTPAPLTSLTALKESLSDDLLCRGLEKTLVVQAPLEIILTNLRSYFLNHWQTAPNWPEETLTFLTALAHQCWSNDFAYYESAAEAHHLTNLEADLARRLRSPIPEDGTAALLALYGCYRPLNHLTESSQIPLADKHHAIRLAPLLKTHVENPAREATIKATIPSFSPISDETSQAVQTMYERRPYPRWSSVDKPAAPPTDPALQNLNFLVAGCGTGQEPALYASALPGTHITAIDLSRTSLAYAKRMADELGLAAHIDFQHGDLMDIQRLSRQFDFIASSGVLHHLANPAKGLQALLTTLKPGGRISLSLYSQKARDDALGPAQLYIREKAYTSSDDDIRAFRRDIINLPAEDPRRRCLDASDFFVLAECNDLLFHVQEHRFTFLGIKKLADDIGLELHDISLAPSTKNGLKALFPDSLFPYSFEQLHEFEQKNPADFLGMYKVYFRRKGDPSIHPLDPLLHQGTL